jgi:hypothetical protein
MRGIQVVLSGLSMTLLSLACGGSHAHPPLPDTVGKIVVLSHVIMIPMEVACIPQSTTPESFSQTYQFVSCRFWFKDPGDLEDKLELVEALGSNWPFGEYFCRFKRNAVLPAHGKITIEGTSRVIFKPTGQVIDLSTASIEVPF